MAKQHENTLINTDKRLFYLSDDIDESTVGKLCFNLLFLLNEDEIKELKEKEFKREPIKLYVNSYGGSVYDMWALIDIIQNSKSPIYTYCTGYAMSAGFKIFLAGHKRFASKHAIFLYHQMSCWREGKYQDLVEDREEMDHMQKSIEDYVLNQTLIKAEKIAEVREKKVDWYIHAEEAKNLGIIDEIL